DDSGTIQHRFGQFVERSRRGVVTGELNHLGCSFGDGGRQDPQIAWEIVRRRGRRIVRGTYRGLSQSDARSPGHLQMVRFLSVDQISGRQRRLRRSKTLLSLKLEL